MAVVTSSYCSNPGSSSSWVGCNDDTNGSCGTRSTVVATLTRGTTYYIVIGLFYGDEAWVLSSGWLLYGYCLDIPVPKPCTLYSLLAALRLAHKEDSLALLG